MTAAIPDGGDDRCPDHRSADGNGHDDEDPSQQPADGESQWDDEEIDRRFSAIVSEMSADMQWGTTKSGDEVGKPPDGYLGRAVIDSAEQRRQRREFRRAEREAEVAAFTAEQARKEAEYAADTEHFVPADPPPIKKPKLRTVLAAVLIVCGIFVLIGPNLLTVSPNGIIILSGSLIFAGCGLLLAGMRRHAGSDLEDDEQV
ncbi:MAG: hypothetical protein M3Y77_19780 [Actinomycetota bacterium]|nr:hypothetical protein [Actinomycetota bacterium]